MLSKAEIFGGQAPTDELDVPQWGGKVRIRGLTVLQNETCGKVLRGENKNHPIASGGYAAAVVCYGVIDADGRRVFEDADAFKLGGLPESSPVDTLAIAILKMSGSTVEAEAELRKN